MEESDEIAIVRARKGDLDAFRVLVDRHGRAIYRLAYRMTGNREDAEDMAQDAFLKAYRRLDEFDFRASFGTWLHRIAANGCIDLLRSRKRRGESSLEDDSVVPGGEPGPERLARSSELSSKVRETLDRMTPQERAAFVLRHFEGRSIAEIGPALGLSVNGTKQSIFRAVEKLRRALGPHVAAPPASALETGR